MDEFEGHELDFHTDTIWGWRVFQIRNDRLYPIASSHGYSVIESFGDTIWFRPAECNQNTLHDAPQEDCGCGYWGMWNVDNLVSRVGLGTHSRDNSIVTRIEVKGRVLLGADGFRAKRIRIIGRLDDKAYTSLLTRHLNVPVRGLPTKNYNRIFPNIPRISYYDLEELRHKEIDPYDFVPEEKKHHSIDVTGCKCNTCRLFRKTYETYTLSTTTNRIPITGTYGNVTITGQNFTTYTSGDTNNPPTLGNIQSP